MRKIPCEVYSRVVGYFRPVQNWNLGKREEFKDRVAYSCAVSLGRESESQARHAENLQPVYAS